MHSVWPLYLDAFDHLDQAGQLQMKVAVLGELALPMELGSIQFIKRLFGVTSGLPQV